MSGWPSWRRLPGVNSFMSIDQPSSPALPRETIFAGVRVSLYAVAPSDLSATDAMELEVIDRDIGGLGFVRLGDLMCSLMPDAVIRCYGRADTEYYGAHVRTDRGDSFTDFYTEFADGSSLTTSTNRASVSYPEARIYRRVALVEDAAGLEVVHRAAILEHAVSRRTRALPARADLTACAAMIERFLDRYVQVLPQTR